MTNTKLESLKYSGSASALCIQLQSLVGEGPSAQHQFLKQSFPGIFKNGEAHALDNGALLIEIPGASNSNSFLFLSRLPGTNYIKIPQNNEDHPHVAPYTAHTIALLSALEELIQKNFRPSGTLSVALSYPDGSVDGGAMAMSRILKVRNEEFTFILDAGGFVVQDAFAPLLSKGTKTALVGITEHNHSELNIEVEADDSDKLLPPLETVARAAVKLSTVRKTRKFHMYEVAKIMLNAIAPNARWNIRFVLKNPYFFKYMLKHYLEKTPLADQLFHTSLYIKSITSSLSSSAPAKKAKCVLILRELPSDADPYTRERLSTTAANVLTTLSYVKNKESKHVSAMDGVAWDVLKTAMQLQFPNTLIVPYASPYDVDAEFYSSLCKSVYRFSPFTLNDPSKPYDPIMVSDSDWISAIQFFRHVINI